MGRKYSKVERYVWRDPGFRSLARDPRDLWLYLLTCPQQLACPGLMVTDVGAVSSDLQWPEKAVTAALKVLIERGWVEYDKVVRVVLLPNAIAHNLPENDNVVKGWHRALSEVPECVLRDRWVAVLHETVKSLAPKRFSVVEKLFANHSETVSKPYRNPDPDPDPDPEPEPILDLPLPHQEPAPAPEYEGRAGEVHALLAERFTQRLASLSSKAVRKLVMNLTSEDFAGVDVLAEIRAARRWEEKNPKKRKTARGLPKYLIGWVERAQNNPRQTTRENDDRTRVRLEPPIGPPALKVVSGTSISVAIDREEAAGADPDVVARWRAQLANAVRASKAAGEEVTNE